MKCFLFSFLVILLNIQPIFSQKDKISILFIGNSLTYTNDLPSLVKIEGKKKGLKIKTTMIAKPNYAIIDHLNEGRIQKEINSKSFDYIIIQQGPSSQPEGRELLFQSGIDINNLIKDSKAKLVYFMVWPSLNYYYTFDKVIKNHYDAAEINNALICPVGEIWKEYFDTSNNFEYYGSDGFHPSLKGSKIAAKVIVDELF